MANYILFPLHTMTAIMNQNLREALDNFFLDNTQLNPVPHATEEDAVGYDRAIHFFRSVAWLYRDKIFAPELWRAISESWVQIGGTTSRLAFPPITENMHAIPPHCFDVAIALIIAKVCVEFPRQRGPININQADLFNLIRPRDYYHGIDPFVAYRRLGKNTIIHFHRTCENAIYSAMPILELEHQVKWHTDVIQEVFDEQRGRMGTVGSLPPEIVHMLKEGVREKVFGSSREYVGIIPIIWAQNKILRTQIDPVDVRFFIEARF